MNPTQSTAATLNPVIASSTDPTQVANTIKGIILAASTVITFFAFTVFHINLSAQNINDLATGLSFFAAGVWFFFGLFHKLVAWYGHATAPKP